MAPASFGWLPPAVNCCATYCLHPVPDDALREMQSRQEAIDIHAPGAPPVTAGNRTGGSSHICPRRWRWLHIRTGAINPRWALCLCFNQFFFFFFYPLLNWHLHWASFNSLKKNTATVSSSIKVVFLSRQAHRRSNGLKKTHLFMYVQYNPSQSTGKHYNSWCCNK